MDTVRSTPPVRKIRRSRTGCRNCRDNKVKCDEARPHCGRCSRLALECDYRPRARKKYTRRGRHAEAAEPAPTAPSSGHDEADKGVSPDGSATAPRSRQPPSSEPAPVFDWDFAVPTLIESVHEAPSAVLCPLDFAALHYFPFILPCNVDSKAPEHSGPAIVWSLAERDSMVMHGVCAVAGRKLCERVPLSPDEIRDRQCVAVEHCTEALRLLNLALKEGSQMSDPNCILATMWLMIQYEQKFSDGSDVGFIAHLNGAAAALFHGKLRDMTQALASSRPGYQESQICSLTSQLVVWIALVDGGAAVNGFGGAFCRLLGGPLDGVSDMSPLSRLRIFRTLQMRASLVNRDLWAATYPQDQFVEDLQNRELFCLQTETGQLRFMLGLLDKNGSSPAREDSSYAPSCSFSDDEIGSAIHDVGNRYDGLLSAASLLEVPKLASPNQKRFAINMRFICSFYRAVVLVYLRAVGGSAPLGDQQHACLREIMALASKAHTDDGDEALQRFSWALFVAALETEDTIHRTWIVDRFEALRRGGENFRRAHDALVIGVRERESGRRIDYLELVRRGDFGRFVLE